MRANERKDMGIEWGGQWLEAYDSTSAFWTSDKGKALRMTRTEAKRVHSVDGIERRYPGAVVSWLG